MRVGTSELFPTLRIPRHRALPPLSIVSPWLSFVVSPATPHELLSACRLLFGREHAERSRERLLADGHPPGLFVARAPDGQLRAAALVQALPGALGVAWTPRGESRVAVNTVTAAACVWLRTQGVKVCQVYCPVGETADMAPLERNGFQAITQLVFLRRKPSRVTPAPSRNSQLMFAWEMMPLHDDVENTLLATHEGSLDCPELNAGRTPRRADARIRCRPPMPNGFSQPAAKNALGWPSPSRARPTTPN